MINKRIIYIVLALFSIISYFTTSIFPLVLTVVTVFILYLNRGLFLVIKANKNLTNNNVEKGYEILGKAYRAGIPFVISRGYIHLSLKYGHFDTAISVINDILNGKTNFKLKDGQRESILTQKSVYLWKTDGLDTGIELLEELYSKGFRSSIFYGNFGCLLQLKGDLKRAEAISLEAYEYGKTDKVTLDNLIAIYIDLNDWDSAKHYFEELILLDPSFCEAFYHGALLELNRGNLTDAKKFVEKAYSFDLSYISSITIEDLDLLKSKVEANS